jgi:hypothetical protein
MAQFARQTSSESLEKGTAFVCSPGFSRKNGMLFRLKAGLRTSGAFLNAV